MTTSEMRAALVTKFAQKIHFLLAAAQNQPYEEGDVCDECLVHARELAALATPSVAPPQAEARTPFGTCKRESPLHTGDALHVRSDGCVGWKLVASVVSPQPNTLHPEAAAPICQRCFQVIGSPYGCHCPEPLHAAAPVGEPTFARKENPLDARVQAQTPVGEPGRTPEQSEAELHRNECENCNRSMVGENAICLTCWNKIAAPPVQGEPGRTPQLWELAEKSLSIDYGGEEKPPDGSPWAIRYTLECDAAIRLTSKAHGQMARAQIRGMLVDFANRAAAPPAQGAPGTREAQLLARGLSDVAAGRIRSLEEIKDSQKHGYLLEDMDRAHGFLRGRRMPLNMEENEAMHRDLAIEFAEVRADEAKYIRSPEEAKARIAALAQPGAPTKEGSDVTRS